MGSWTTRRPALFVRIYFRNQQKICIAVAQVHEQPNGGGFPKGLPSHRIMFISKILAIVDAYLTLTSSLSQHNFPKAVTFNPATALPT